MRVTCALGIGVVAAGLMWVEPSSAQGVKPQFGPVVGLNVSILGGKDASGASSRTGVAVGGTVAFGFKNGFYLQPMALYSVKGARYTSTSRTADVKPSYLEIPVMLGYQIPMRNSSLTPRLFVGPDLGIELGCKVSLTSADSTTEASCNDPNLGLMNTTVDFGMLGGAGIGFPLGRGSLEINAFYSAGLSQIWSRVDAKNRSFSVNVGYLFPTGK